ncbi:hypothetical protein CFY86_08390 [Raoultella ornithinolytica]|uniref:Uncharacterized protein n=2 Tax=Raoultella ornithinolytica TaxID=54291 RepID=A0A855F2U0_RAOOR|nr:hypothetical protein CFY86_08390 [Raoultella ornithinolytica]
MAKYLGVSDRTIRNFVAGKTVPDNISKRLIDAINTKHAEAMMIINNDKMNGDEITIDLITEIVDHYEYADSMTREHAIDAINNAIYQETFISDLDAIARKFSV